MHFSRLQLHGFKSFVDETEMLIDSGLTGIVGPNGCGKSNLVEALRWVMGESSARSLRGGDMDDVIFGGTNSRASRNIAEVILTIDNADRSAPVVINDAETIDVSRRITRGQGSNYRINGREIRAKDVQLLFADASTGAHSPSLVSQGKISALISMRPVERRAILEDAAGIAGLYARRHEAELKLSSADSNLLRVDDQVQALEAVLQSLTKQVKLVQKYRALGESIRSSEAHLLWLEWQAAQAERSKGLARIREAEAAVVARQIELSARVRDQTEAAALVPSLRQEAMAAGEALNRLTLESRDYESEVMRRAEKRKLLDAQCEQIARDQNREIELSTDANRELQRLQAQLETISHDSDLFGDRLSEAKSQLSAVEEKLKTIQTEWQESQRQVSGLEARRGDWQRRGQSLQEKRQRILSQQQELEAQKSRLSGTEREIAAIAEFELRLSQAAQNLTAALDSQSLAEQLVANSRAPFATTTAEWQELQAEVTELKGEKQGVTAAINSLTKNQVQAQESTVNSASLINGMTIAAGWEAAVAAALGEELLEGILSGDREKITAASGWLTGASAEAPDFSSLTGVTRLDQWVELADRVPAELRLALSAVAVVEDESLGWQEWPHLRFGQRLVSKSGRAWRYDGFYRGSLTKSSAASQALTEAARQRRDLQNRFTAIDSRLSELEAKLAVKQENLQSARSQLAQAESALKSAQQGVEQKRGEVQEMTIALNRLQLQSAENRTRLTSINETLARVAVEAAEVSQIESAYAAEINPTAELNEARSLYSQRQNAIVAAQSERDSARRNLESRQRENEGRKQKIESLTLEQQNWQARTATTEQRLAELQSRLSDSLAEIEEIKAQTIAGLDRRQELAERINGAEAIRGKAQEQLLKAEQSAAAAETLVKRLEAQFATAKEELIRAQAMQDSLDQNAAMIAAKSLEKLQVTIESLSPPSDSTKAAEPIDEVRRRLDRLLRERDGLGEINLRAEVEASEYQSQLDLLLSEKADLVAAIAKLRSAINELNRDGSQRLIAAFAEVNQTFTRLFESLFGGGKAYLQLTENEDPLAAGLDIFASPPGKKLQNLSLLSGGEQALTALALIFAVFLTKPSPICVLDEVDAALDDANVDRFCSCLAEIAATSGTRFLVITHHRLTMSRMDRLYGVTMAERGISQLVSVDLAHAERIKERA